MPQLIETPFISVCMPIYRRPTFLRQALESAISQTYANFEIIVHDDTEDDTLKVIVESYDSAKVRYFQNKPPLGIIPKLNDFLEKSKAEWIVILCDDDMLEPDFLKTLSKHIETNPSASLIRCRYRLMDHHGKELRLDRISPTRSTSFEFLRDLFLPESKTFKMNISGVLFPKLLLQSLGGFKDLYRGWHVDRLAWAELGARGETICDSAPLCNIRLHADSITSLAEPNYQKAIEADLEMQTIVTQLFDSTEKTAQAEQDLIHLKEARKNFRAYTERHLSKSMDKGMFSALGNHDQSAGSEVYKILKIRQNLRVPFFLSAFLYQILAPFPYRVRTWALTRICRYKIKKLQAVS